MERLPIQTRFQWELVSFVLFLFLMVCDVFALLHSPPVWFSKWPHWTWQDWASFSGDLFFPMMALVSFVEMRKYKRLQG